MYVCARDIDFASSYDLSIGFWNCSDSVVFSFLQFIKLSKYSHCYIFNFKPKIYILSALCFNRHNASHSLLICLQIQVAIVWKTIHIHLTMKNEVLVYHKHKKIQKKNKKQQQQNNKKREKKKTIKKQRKKQNKKQSKQTKNKKILKTNNRQKKNNKKTKNVGVNIQYVYFHFK